MGRRSARGIALVLLVWAGVGAGSPSRVPAAFAAEPLPVVRVGSKSFTESYLLGEIVAQVLERVGEVRVDRRFGLGGTGITYRAIETGAIDIYPEYTGTLARIMLKDPSLGTAAAIRQRVAPLGLTISDSLGFSNTYALAVLERTAERLRLRTIGDLARHRALTAGFTSGFLEREDGWPGLRRHYELELAQVRAIEHALAYRAIASGDIEVIDIFSTDGQLERLQLRILEDDRAFFPDYAAVLLARRDFVERFPRSWQALETTLVGRLDDRSMRRLNARVDLDGQSVAQAAAEFLGTAGRDARPGRVTAREIGDLTLQHLALVAAALAVAVLVGIPLGILAARFRRIGQVELAAVGMLQTVPALALLVFMIPLLGIGTAPALVALCLYALLPIVRNTYAGLISIDRQLLEIAEVLGLGRRRRVLRIELPLSSVGIMAGIKTSAVMTVGTATLAAFIGGGGYGTLIVRGLALDDIGTILAGALPAAGMAAALQGIFELVDRLVIPRGLRERSAGPENIGGLERPPCPNARSRPAQPWRSSVLRHASQNPWANPLSRGAPASPGCPERGGLGGRPEPPISLDQGVQAPADIQDLVVIAREPAPQPFGAIEEGERGLAPTADRHAQHETRRVDEADLVEPAARRRHSGGDRTQGRQRGECFAHAAKTEDAGAGQHGRRQETEEAADRQPREDGIVDHGERARTVEARRAGRRATRPRCSPANNRRARPPRESHRRAAPGGTTRCGRGAARPRAHQRARCRSRRGKAGRGPAGRRARSGRPG